MSLVLGKDVNLYINYNGQNRVIGCVSRCSLTTATEIGERSTISSGLWKQVKALALSASLQLEGDIFFYSSFDITDLVNLQFSLLSLGWSFEQVDTTGNARTYSGRAVIESIEQGGDTESPATFSASLIVDGEISIGYNPVIITPGGVQTYTYTAQGGETLFTASVLINKDVLLVFEDGTALEVVTVTPANQQAQYTAGIGEIAFDHTLQTGEIIIVTYQ